MRTCATFIAVCLLVSSVPALAPDLRTADAFRQMRPARPGPSAVGCEQLPDGGEFLIDTSVSLVPAPKTQSEPAVAFNGADFLMVWEDYRNGSSDIYGARVNPTGTVLDTAGFVISQAANDQRVPDVSFDGTDFLVVWEDNRSGSDYHIYGARVNPTGTVLDTAGFVISRAANDPRVPDVSFDGTDFLVVWEDNRSGSDYHIYGARVTSQGAVLDSAGIVISQAANSQYSPALAFDGADFLVTWRDFRGGTNYDIYGARVTPQGVVLDSAGIAISQSSGDQNSPALCFDGANFLAVWQDDRDGTNEVYGARIAPEGVVLDSAGFAISHAAHGQYAPALSFDGANFLVTWRDFRSGTDYDICGARVTPQGVVLDSAGVIVSTAADNQWSPVMGFDGTNFFVAWEDCRNGNDGDIYGARVTPRGAVLDTAGIIISQVVNDQWSPALAFDGTNFLVAWEGRRSDGGYNIYGARVTPQGVVLDSADIVISQAADSQCCPALAFDGSDFLVVWQDDCSGSGYDIYGVRVTPQGTVLDSTSIVITQAVFDQSCPALAFDGVNFLVIWADCRSGTNYDIYGARVTPQGAVLDTAGFVITQAANTQYTPALVFDGANFLTVWEDWNGGSDIYGARVTPQGTVLDHAGIVISRAANTQYAPALASDGANSLVVWADRRGGTDYDVYGARVTPRGTVLDTVGIVISQALGHQWCPAVAFDGGNFLAEWIDNRGGTECDIYGARLTPAGTVFGGGSVVSRQGDLTWQGPRLSCGIGGQMLLVYQGRTEIIGDKTYNTERVWGKVNPNPGIEESFKPGVARFKPLPTIVRRILYMAERASSSPSTSSLLDISGRKVLDLHPGANDVRALAPGVYLIRGPKTEDGRPAPSVRKVVLTE